MLLLPVHPHFCPRQGVQSCILCLKCNMKVSMCFPHRVFKKKKNKRQINIYNIYVFLEDSSLFSHLISVNLMNTRVAANSVQVFLVLEGLIVTVETCLPASRPCQCCVSLIALHYPCFSSFPDITFLISLKLFGSKHTLKGKSSFISRGFHEIRSFLSLNNHNI